jgi:small subunit ribosomal protein S1
METEKTATPEKIQVKRKDHFLGTVEKITLAGAVIQLGLDRPGFLHLAKMDDKINNVSEILKEGQEINVWVQRPAPNKPFIELTTKEPLALEWGEIRKGMTLKGKVEKLERFGAFVDIGAERPGLVHVSEMSHDYIRSPEEAVKVGEEIEVRVLDVNRKKRQIKLSMKALVEKPDEILEALNQQGDEAEAEVPTVTAMEYALRSAMNRSKGDKPRQKKSKRVDSGKKALEDFYTRTLENYKED